MISNERGKKMGANKNESNKKEMRDKKKKKYISGLQGWESVLAFLFLASINMMALTTVPSIFVYFRLISEYALRNQAGVGLP
jgi:hypothetical protein